MPSSRKSDDNVALLESGTKKGGRGAAAADEVEPAADCASTSCMRTLYGDISAEELKKFALLGATFFFIIGSYWLLRPLKDGVFNATVGIKEYQPTAKMLSVFVVVFVVMGYGKLVDRFDRVQLFYIVCGFFGAAFFAIAVLLGHDTIGLPNEEKSPARLFGWAVYFIIECYGSLTVSMFWSFVSSSTASASARRGYSIIVGLGNVGSIAGPLLAVNARALGMQLLFAIGGWCVLLVVVLLRSYVSSLSEEGQRAARGSPADAAAAAAAAAAAGGKEAAAKKTGFVAGARLILTRPYVFGILLVSTLYEVVATITDYQMKVIAQKTPGYEGAEGLTSFLGLFGIVTNSVALVLSLLGTSIAMRRFGLRFCLLAYPLSVAATSCTLFLLSSLPAKQLLWLTFVAMVATKGLSYALNNPAKEMMYIPTSHDVKYKAKSWIDVFGGRTAKATGSLTTDLFIKGLSSAGAMMRVGAVVSLVITGGWAWAANKVGRTYERLVAEDRVIE